jgi:hypothetical protein
MRALLPLLGAALAAPSLTDADVVSALTEFQRHAHFTVPMPGPRRRGQLIDGQIIKLRLPSEDGAPVGAMALLISDLSKEELWLGTCDDEGGADTPEELTVHHLTPVGDEMFRWYGYVRLPSPIADRHWLIQTSVDTARAAATGGRMWSRYWEMEPGGEATARAEVASGRVRGVTADLFDKAVWTPHNTGTWLFVDLPDGRSMLGYQATASMGGNFPDGLVNRYVYWGLESVMKDVLKKAGRARGHYVKGHPPIDGGDKRPLPPFDAPSMSAP